MHNLNRAFNALLDELDLKTGADGRTRTLYSWRHFYATQDLEHGGSKHALVIPPKIIGVQKWNFLGKISEEIFDEERTI